MNKEEMIESLQRAKKIHIAQMQKIESLLDGDSVENPTAVSKTECDYGKWFYGNKDQVMRIIGAQLYERIDKFHEEWHMGYVRIFNIFFKDKKEGLFSKLLGSHKANPLEIDKGRLYYLELNEVTKNLLSATDAAIRRVSALNESKF